MGEARKLAAVLAADSVGIRTSGSAHDQANSAPLRDAIFDPTTATYKGRVFRATRDGFLAEFESPVDAVRCAIAIQVRLSALPEPAPAERRLAMQMGVHLGDVHAAGDGDLEGEAVDVAKQLQALAEPGAIFLSDTVHRQVQASIDVEARDRGPRRLKDRAGSVRVFALQPTLWKASPKAGKRRLPAWLQGVLAATAAMCLTLIAAAAALYPYYRLPAALSGADVAKKFSIVILPFSNLSADASQDYVADALVDELTTYVSRIPEAFVIARNSAFAYRGKAIDIKQIGDLFGVRYALEGSIQFNQQRVRVNAQLIETETEKHVWAEAFDEDRTDLFQMEDNIVTRLARALDIQFTAVEAARAARDGSVNASAQELAWQCAAAYSEARTSGVDAEKHAKAISLCERALQIDPNNFLALRTQATDLTWKITSGQSSDMIGDIERATGLGLRLIALRPDSSDAHLVKGMIAFMTGFLERAEAEFRASAAANPVNMEARFELCDVQTAMGRSQDALDCYDQFIRASPRDPLLFAVYYEKGSNFEIMQRFEDALVWTERSLTLAPEHPAALRLRAVLLLRLGRESEARAAYARYRALPGTNISTLTQYRSYLTKAWVARNPPIEGTIERRIEAMRKLGMPN